jgi:DNA mismatch repair protein MutS2
VNEHDLRTLEFAKILSQMAEHTAFSASRELALALRPSTDAYEVRQRQQATTEAKDLIGTRPDVTLGAARDVRPHAERAALLAMLQPHEILEVRDTLLSARRLGSLLMRLEDEYPLLADKAARLDPLPELADAIGRCLDDDGNVLDTASPELARIRRELRLAQDHLAERLRRFVSDGDNVTYLQEPIVTERNGRYVVPLKIQFKGRIPGIVHDTSASGATLFIEPLATVELGNQVQELRSLERHEVERILAELTEMIGDHADIIEVDVLLLAELDLAFACARYSFAQRAKPAEILAADEGSGRGSLPSLAPLRLHAARHPLLPEDTVVPIDVWVGDDARILLITGPNTGGKTVALKTVGLLTAMTQAGMHIPAGEGSSVPVYDGIYADIGDEQSIEQSLSTFSSHMTHIVSVLGQATPRSLVLLDELGAGTDPVEGAALAQALLETLLERGCTAICSTHYSTLKLFAFGTDGIQNASVEFDLETLSPTYNLSIGVPGRSNALAIAKRLGLDQGILDRAAGLVSPQAMEADALLEGVREARDAAEHDREEARKHRNRAARLENDLRERIAQIEDSREDLLEKARAEGRELLSELKDELKALRLSVMSGSDQARAIREATQRQAELARIVEPSPEPSPSPGGPPTDLRPGDSVRIAHLGQVGEVLSVSDQEAEVRVGNLRLRAEPATLERVASAPMEVSRRPRPSTREAVSPGTELDLRGYRADEVASELERYLNSAYMAGLPWCSIIHGKGMGVLKQVVRGQLQGHPLVSEFRPGALAEGGDGVTVVKLPPRRSADEESEG